MCLRKICAQVAARVMAWGFFKTFSSTFTPRIFLFLLFFKTAN